MALKQLILCVRYLKFSAPLNHASVLVSVSVIDTLVAMDTAAI